MNFEVSPHVYERLEERNIPLQVLKLVLEAPQQVLIQGDGTKAYQSKVVMRNKTYLPRVFVNDSVDPIRVKSVYLTSKIDKYWSTK